MASQDKGRFSADIGQDVIEEALKSVNSPPPADPGEVEELRAQLELSQAKGREMMEKIKEAHEKMLRATADLENFKRRAQKEREEVQRFGVERLLKDLLPVADNLDRALEHSGAAVDLDSFRQGIQMTRKLFEDTLARHGVKVFSARGQPFDPRFHEAMQQVETDEVPANHVVSEVLKGYTLNERLVRPALVVVSRAANLSSTAGGDAAQPSPPGEDAPGGDSEDREQGA